MHEAMSKRLRADLSLALCSLLWDATFVVVKNALAPPRSQIRTGLFQTFSNN
jgi:hypothetical protein